MTTFRSALTTLSQLAVTGVSNNYDVDSLPDVLHRAQLPALLVTPVDTQDDRFFKERGEGFQTLAFSSGARSVTYTVTHLLLIAPITAGSGVRSNLPTLIDLIDNYFSAFANDVILNGALLEPAQVKVELGIFSYDAAEYYGCAFRHTWLMEV